MTRVENVGSSGELIMGKDDVLPMVCDAFVGDCELKVDEGRSDYARAEDAGGGETVRAQVEDA